MSLTAQPLALALRGDPHRSCDFSWALLIDITALKQMQDGLKSSVKSDNGMVLKDNISNFMTAWNQTMVGFGSQPGMSLSLVEYVSQLAQVVVIPEDEMDVGEANLAGLKIPYIRGFKLNPIVVTYLEDELSTVYLLHKLWQECAYTWNPVDMVGINPGQPAIDQAKNTAQNAANAIAAPAQAAPATAYKAHIEAGFGFMPLLTVTASALYSPAVRVFEAPVGSNIAGGGKKPPWPIPFMNSDKLGIMDASGPGNYQPTANNNGDGWMTWVKGAVGMAAFATKAVFESIDYVKHLLNDSSASAQVGLQPIGYGIDYFENIFPLKIKRSDSNMGSSEFGTVTVTYMRMPSISLCVSGKVIRGYTSSQEGAMPIPVKSGTDVKKG